MALTLAEMIEEVRTAHSRREDLDDAKVTRALNFGQERVAREPVHWKELEFLVSRILAENQYTFPFSSIFLTDRDVHEIFSCHIVEDGRREKLEHKPAREFDRLVDETDRGQPRYYTWWGAHLYLHPTLDTDYIIRIAYGAWPKALAAPTDTSDLLNKDGIIVAFAISHLFQAIGSSEDAARWYTIGRDQLSKARQSVNYVSDPTVQPADISGDYWRNPFIRSVY